MRSDKDLFSDSRLPSRPIFEDLGRFDRSVKRSLTFVVGMLFFSALFWAGVIVALVWLAFRIWG